MWEMLIEHLPTLITLGVGLLVAWVVRKGWIKADLGEKLKMDVNGAVTSVYHEYVKSRKEANADGKLTDEEKKEARNLALSKLKEVGKEKGIDYAKTYGVPAILGLVEKYVSKNKTKAKVEKAEDK